MATNGHDQKMPGHPNPLHALRPSRRRMLGLAAVGTVGALTAVATGGRPANAVDATVMTVNPRTTTAAINAWLAVGGVRVLRGATVLSGPLVIPSGTQLDASAASITGAIGDNVLRNASAIPTATTTASVRAGSAAITTKAAVFSAASVGRAVQVLGAGPRAGNSAAPGSMYGRIVSVQSSTRATLSVPATGTATAATTYLFPPDDHDISITGGTWTNRSKNSVSQTTESHGLYLRRAARVSLSGLTVHSTGSAQTGGQYAVSFGDVTDVTVEDIAFIDTASDGVHFQGPASKLAIRRITGERTGDDLVAFTTVDGQTHAGSRLGDCEGDITDVVVEDVQGKACLCLLKVTSGIGANGVQRRIRRFSATGFSGTVTGRYPIAIVDYAGPTWFEGTISRVSATASGGTAVQVSVGTLGALVVEDVTAPAGARAAVDGLVRIVAAKATSVTVNRITNRSVAKGTASAVALAIGSVPTVTVSGVACPVLAPQFDSVRLVRASSTIGALSVSNDTSAALNGNVFAVASTAKGYRITKATFSGISRSTGSVWAAEADSTVSTTMTVSGFKGGRAIALLRAPAKITVQGMVQAAGSGGGLRLNSAAASPVRAVIDGASSRGATLVSRTASQKVSVVSPFVPVDAALLTPQDGDVVLNAGGKYAKSQLRWDAKAKKWRTTSVVRPKPTPAPAPSATPKPSASPSAPASPAPSPTVTPSPSSTPSGSPSPSSTPSATPSPSDAPSPSDVPTPSSSPEPVLVP